MDMKIAVESVFHGETVRTLFVGERFCWVATDLGLLLGYSDGGRFVDSVREKWSDYMQDGVDYSVIDPSPDSGGVANGNLRRKTMVLFESGMWTACILSRSKLGAELRRFLANEVLPQIVRTGSYVSSEEHRQLIADFEEKKTQLKSSLRSRHVERVCELYNSSVRPKMSGQRVLSEAQREAYQAMGDLIRAGLEPSQELVEEATGQAHREWVTKVQYEAMVSENRRLSHRMEEQQAQLDQVKARLAQTSNLPL